MQVSVTLDATNVLCRRPIPNDCFLLSIFSSLFFSKLCVLNLMIASWQIKDLVMSKPRHIADMKLAHTCKYVSFDLLEPLTRTALIKLSISLPAVWHRLLVLLRSCRCALSARKCLLETLSTIIS
ncbi:hypothetical protein BJX68DRAFT_64610 [Aspergillus pseudodeflectus]|uniref:Uncharacterized protein n=1 Tax=Aspergillus pseudodeflectus TaxID=176178 RepID=A0ABR4KK17_9EURO